MSNFIEYASLGLKKAKWTFTTRRVNRTDVLGFSESFAKARSGDLVLARISHIGHHTKLQLSSGRPATSYVDDWVVLACGDRYAPDQFEGIAEIDPVCSDLLAAGGLIGRMRISHQRISANTKLRPIAMLTDDMGTVLNLDQYQLPSVCDKNPIPVFLVVGTSMNAGKTTAAASLAHGFTRAGIKVAGIKATGTGAFGDYHMFQDAGVEKVLDFTDAGMASTYKQPISKLEQAFQTLTAHAAVSGAEVAVVELADGIYQRETAALLKSNRVRSQVAGVIFATSDAISAVSGVKQLTEQDLLPIAISGKVSLSPLSVSEIEANTPTPVLTREKLCDADVASGLLPHKAKLPLYAA